MEGNFQPKESQLSMRVRKSVEVNGKKWGYFETGPPDAPFQLLNISGFGAGSGRGMKDYHKH